MSLEKNLAVVLDFLEMGVISSQPSTGECAGVSSVSSSSLSLTSDVDLDCFSF